MAATEQEIVCDALAAKLMVPEALDLRFEGNIAIPRGDYGIAEGSFGKVIKATRKSDGAKLAIKLCKPTADPNNPHLVTLALRELDALRRLDHPRITRLEGVGLAPEYLTAGKHPDSQKAPRSSPPSRPPSTPGTKSPRSMSPRSLIRDAPASYGLVFAIAMEFVEGGSLKQLMVKQMVSPSTRIITWADRLRLARDIAEGMAAIHRQGILHRDLKPDNILVTSRDASKCRAKIADFGLASRVFPSSSAPGTATAASSGAAEALLGLTEAVHRRRASNLGLQQIQQAQGVDPGRAAIANSSGPNKDGSAHGAWPAEPLPPNDAPLSPASPPPTNPPMDGGDSESEICDLRPLPRAPKASSRPRSSSVGSRDYTDGSSADSRGCPGIAGPQLAFCTRSLAPYLDPASASMIKAAAGPGTEGPAAKAGRTSRDLDISPASATAAATGIPLLRPVPSVAWSSNYAASIPLGSGAGPAAQNPAPGAAFLHRQSQAHQQSTPATSNLYRRGSSRTMEFRSPSKWNLSRFLSRSILCGARARGQGDASTELDTSGFAGTALYASPEEISAASPRTFKSEVFSYAIVLYELFRGCPFPLSYQSEAQVADHLNKICMGWRPECSPTWPPTLTALIKSMWVPEGEARPSFDEIVAFFDGNKERLEAEVAQADSASGCNCTIM